PPPYAMFRRPARDRNYEFWGDQTFYGENPPQAAVLSWLNKKPVGDVKLRVTDAAGRVVRDLSGQVMANSNKARIQSAGEERRGHVRPAAPAPVSVAAASRARTKIRIRRPVRSARAARSRARAVAAADSASATTRPARTSPRATTRSS